MRWRYASDLRDLIHAHWPDLWVHGHIHHAADYRVGRTRIVCNPRDHVDEASGFEPCMIVYPSPRAGR